MSEDAAPLFSRAESGDSSPLVIDAETAALVDLIAERTAEKIAQGLLRLPDSVHGTLKTLAPAGFYAPPVHIGYGPEWMEIRVFARPTGLELTIDNPAGETLWRTELV